MTWTTDSLGRAEEQLDLLTRGQEDVTLHRWRNASAELADAAISRPGQLRGWLRTRPTPMADGVLRGLVRLAQRGDATALLAVLVCLAPGIRTLSRRTGVSLDEAMSEVTLGVLEYPYARRSSIAGGLLLDARNRISRGARRAPEPVDDPASCYVAGRDGAVHQPGERLGDAAAAGPTTAERILAIICEARRRNILDEDDAQLIVDTRLSGDGVGPAAARLGISPAAAYQRRSRAERRLNATLGGSRSSAATITRRRRSA